MESLTRVIQRLSYYVCVVGMVALIPLMLLTTADVLTRAIANKPIQGVVELSEFMLAVVILLGIAYTQQLKGHPRATLIIERLPRWLQSVCDIITNLLSLFIVFILAWRGWVVAFGPMGKTVSDVLRIPQLPFRLLVTAGGIFLFLEIAIDLSASVKNFARELAPGTKIGTEEKHTQVQEEVQE